MLSLSIVEVAQADFQEWLDLALELWTDYSVEEMQASLNEILHSPRQSAVLVKTETGSAIAFMNLSLRSDYVPGATQSPVAFVEGIYVKPDYQKQGVGKALIQYAEQWAQAHGCVELASDALLENTTSHAFHRQVGFQEVERLVAFIKPIAPTNDAGAIKQP
ncbi:Aminoglycoside 6'-N-acetyltransferase (plasmid) [Leptolyngbya boryana IAM M-101]|nr:GNAT family N-acetyltransferase [Leptolyngbya sp. FACHB-161]MBD2375948.1 GNAT family N-acetyltransferase [Leptolyngbya sp. FACHB-238]MBD2400224.1 GNAT family N-acetyltransferase [Leptolyngbya sp. FACHB-239]MBD2406765.1 GNAT family N-acetyltransferase [Leptolyngbya sp. FACHB-402]BAS60077.1 Aminoglycoside 6'-N-acetyltransferase [Leptolyngbya boryana IAM M-101]BAS66425.1 Aminoglycoside 6'-N-acetyltransferase [Leptolyngbya boryana dg5]